ncbi:LacI family DNA-binding transcriptional regulator [Shimia sediminis]|uniref:LacI family DNA-binding transcriptional regulator n=1 Tax=Shimia sediminis TaxID=2497945 RepID=UPI000F8D7EF2|nr:LacI family DNA-binding transcriptional regulator [Shimia sediminis]
MAKRSITSYDVAKAAGVSQSAVSRAFSPGAPISKKKRQLILNVAKDLGYQPNAIARSMSTARKDTHQRSGMVGVIVTRLQDPFFAQTIADFSRLIQAQGWQMLLFTVDGEGDVNTALNTLMQYKIDGVVILSAILSEQMAKVCRAQGIPVMLYNRSVEGLDVNHVQIHNHDGGRLAADFLVEAGHRRIAFIGGEDGDATSAAREAGFVERLAEAGLSLFSRESGNYTFEGGAEAALRLFSRSERPDAVFCASDVMALGVMHAARTEMGLEIPDDFSLIGFDDIPAAGWPGHGLTTIRQPVGRMISEAVECLVSNMRDTSLAPSKQRFEGQLILRKTVKRAQPG